MNETSFTIHFIITGGTMDSHYDGSKDTVVPNKESIIPSFVEGLRLYHGLEFTTVCMKDSRELTREDLQHMLTAIEESTCDKIIITHGTYTMPDTARFLKANLQRNDQTIILTASMIPLGGVTPSDAPFNLGYTIAKLEDLKPGIYVAMNGKVFVPEEIIKVLSEARFASIFQK